MVWVPGGEFTMVSDGPDALPSERPGHRVRVGGFWMDETDVTNASVPPVCRRHRLRYDQQPYTYDYGSDVVYQDNTVYVGGKDAGTAEQYAQQATTIAVQGQAVDV